MAEPTATVIDGDKSINDLLREANVLGARQRDGELVATIMVNFGPEGRLCKETSVQVKAGQRGQAALVDLCEQFLAVLAEARTADAAFRDAVTELLGGCTYKRTDGLHFHECRICGVTWRGRWSAPAHADECPVATVEALLEKPDTTLAVNPAGD